MESHVLQAPSALSVLTWRSPATLASTLQSLSSLAPLFAERYVICQEADPREIALAESHGFTAVPLARNVGIQAGLTACVATAKARVVLTVENDCPFVGGSCGVGTVGTALALVHREEAEVVQMQQSNGFSRRFKRYWKGPYPPRPTIVGRFRPDNALSAWSEVVRQDGFPAAGTAEITRLGDGIYRTLSSMRPWSNRPFITSKAFFLERLLCFAEANPTHRLVNGFPDLEHAVNSRKNRAWWRNEQLRVGFLSPGCFGHARLERPAGDEKAQAGE